MSEANGIDEFVRPHCLFFTRTSCLPRDHFLRDHRTEKCLLQILCNVPKNNQPRIEYLTYTVAPHPWFEYRTFPFLPGHVGTIFH